MRTRPDAFFAARTLFRVFKGNPFTPPRARFADYLLGTSRDTSSTYRAQAEIGANVWRDNRSVRFHFALKIKYCRFTRALIYADNRQTKIFYELLIFVLNVLFERSKSTKKPAAPAAEDIFSLL